MRSGSPDSRDDGPVTSYPHAALAPRHICYIAVMTAALAPVTLRLSHVPAAPRVNPAIEAVKQMSVPELRAEIRARRNVTPAEREQGQREAVARRAAAAVARLHALGN